MTPKEAKEAVLEIHNYAQVDCFGGKWFIFPSMIDAPIGEGGTESDAWINAAHSLTKKDGNE